MSKQTTNTAKCNSVKCNTHRLDIRQDKVTIAVSAQFRTTLSSEAG